MYVLVVGLWLLAMGRCWLTPALWLFTAHRLQGVTNCLQWHRVSGAGMLHRHTLGSGRQLRAEAVTGHRQQ